MDFLQILVVATLTIAAILTFTMAGLSWRRRPTLELLPFSLMMFAVGIWSLGYLLELVAPDLEAKKFWLNIQYIGISLAPTFWLLFAYQYAGLDRRRLSAFFLIILFGLPVITILLSWTNDLHHWMRSDLHLQSPTFFGELGKTWGPWFWIQVSFSYLLMLSGTVLLIRGSLLSRGIYRRQRTLVVIAALLPWIGDFLHLIGVFHTYDPSPLIFSLTGIILAFGLLRWRLIDLVPVARESVLESLEDGVVVMDDEGWIVDANPYASRLLNRRLDKLVGSSAAEVFAVWPDLCAMLRSSELTSAFRVELRGSWFDLRVEPVSDLRGRVIGRMVVQRDVTLLVQAENRLRLLNEDLERRVQQRTAELSEELENRRRTEAALAASEERYALATRGANDGLWDWDIISGSVFFSSRWSEIFDLEGGEMVGTIDEWFNRVHPDDVIRVRRELWSHLEGSAKDFRSEHRLTTPSGSERWVMVRGQAVFDAGNKPLRMAGSFSDITPRKKAENQLVHNAMHDLLTGLPNRALFIDRLGQALERARRNPEYRFAALYLDFDRFKLINDSLGHNIGDLLLIASARRLNAAVRGIDTAARLGGDEFVVLLEDVAGVEEAVLVAERIQHDLGLVFQLEGYQVYNSVSIGIVINQPGYERPDEVLRDADIAMYHAKLQGRARCSIFDTSMRERTRSRLEIETDLRFALERGELSLHYQPLVQLDTGQLRGFEALLRWRQPDRGEIDPADFIPVAEETGLILSIGRWVLREACRQMGAWRAAYAEAADLKVNVNVSARQLSQGNFSGEVEDALRDSGLPASALRLELTESALLEENEVVAAALSRLRELGVSLHLDDFGTGYSSLSYLYRYRVDALKIDRSFIARMSPDTNGAEIVRTILTLARELKMEVVAEGVETSEQLEALQRLHCQLGQGYWIARPVDAADTEEFIRTYIAGLS